ncbi:MAG: hypothetical protein WBM44_23955 [Waterburya sp.]
MAREYWNYVGCINNSNLSLIEDSLVKILSQQGFNKLNSLPEYLLTNITTTYSPKQYLQLIKKVLIIVLFPGASEWTVIKTIPKEFLCRRSNNSSKPRLSELTVQSNCQAFHWSVYHGTFGVLLEANKQGDIFLSGSHSAYNKLDRRLYYQERINYDEEWQFCLLDIPENIKEAIKPKTREELERAAIKLQELQALSDRGIDTFKEQMELNFNSGTTADLALRRSIGNSSPYWKRGGNIGVLCMEQKKIIAGGGKILYFKTPEYYQHINAISDIEGKY